LYHYWRRMAMAESSPRHSVSVAAAIVDESGQLLAVRRRDNGHWEPPGGILELHETIQAGLVREVREETGLEVEPQALSGVYKNMRRGIVALVFRCRIIGGEPRPTREAEQVSWLSPDEISNLMDEAYATRLLDALRPGPAAIRAHDGLSLLPI
jgi:8-oxo-dGTP diphosphatase